MPPPPASSRPPSNQSTWVETETGNKVSRRAQLHGTQHITLGGRCVISPNVCIRGDLVRPPPSSTSSQPTSSTAKEHKKPHPITSVTLGKYVILCPHVLLKPPLRLLPPKDKTASPNALQYLPLTMGSHVYIASQSSISAASIGDHVVVECECVIGNLAILKDGCRVLRGSVVPDGMVVPPGVVVAGRPARVMGEVGVGWGVGEDEVGGEGGDLREVWRGAGRKGGVGWDG